MIRVFVLIFITLVSVHSLASDCVEVDLYVKDGASIENASEHPCGYVLTQCLRAIPLNDNRLEPVWAYEISQVGRVINKWPLPVDAQVYSVSGSSIEVGYPNYERHGNGWENPAFAQVKSNGSISRKPAVSIKKLNGIECSKITNDATVSLVCCRKYKDKNSGEIRIIAFPEVCT